MVTIDELKQYLKIPESDTTNDDLLDLAIETARDLIRNTCNQPVELTTIDYYVSKHRGNELFLPFMPVNTVNYVKYATERPATWYSLDSSYYELFEMNNLYYLYNSEGFAYNYRINLTVGYTTVPDDVRATALEMAATYVKNSDIFGEGRLGIGSKSVNLPNGTSENTVYIDMLKRWRDTLRHYRISI